MSEKLDLKSVTEGKCPDLKTKSFETVKQCIVYPLLAGILPICGSAVLLNAICGDLIIEGLY